MKDRLGINTDYLSLKWWRVELTVLGARLEQSSLMPRIEFPVVAITAPIAVVLVVSLGSALGVALPWSLAVATTLGLALVMPFMLRAMLSSTPTETVDTLFIAPTSLAADASSSYEDQDYEGWFGPMENSTSLNDLTGDQLELISELLGAYQEGGDLTQPEWASVAAALDIVDARLEEI